MAANPPSNLARTQPLADRLAELVPGGAHTYAKGADQYPANAPGVIARGQGCHVWDADGNEYIEYGMGLRAVGLGHAYPAVVDAVRASLDLGTNFTRPAIIELEAAERCLEVIPNADMVKFTKDGSTATTAAMKLARKATGRPMVAICGDHPFFSYDDWFIGTTTMDGGIPGFEIEHTASFHYNDIASFEAMLDRYDGLIAGVILEVVRGDAPAPGFLERIRELCTERGVVLVFDEMITGFRYALGGAQSLYGAVPDLATWGKALANGFSVSALAGRADLMRLGGRGSTDDDVFLLSTTHGAETPALAAAIATIEVYTSEPVIEHLDRIGRRLSDGLREVSAAHGMTDHVFPVGFPCNLVFATLDPSGAGSQEFRTLFLQELVRRGVLGPSLVVSYSHTDADVDATLEAMDGALGVYAKAIAAGTTDGLLEGPPSRMVFGSKLH